MLFTNLRYYKAGILFPIFTYLLYQMKQRVWVGALDWGLGHATRCIPVIDYLLSRDIEVSLGGAGESLQLLRDAYPKLPTLALPAYKVAYSQHGRQLQKIGTQIPRLLQVIRKERQALAKWVHTHAIDGIISDNRYGCWHPQVATVFICHQLSPRLPRHLAIFHPALSWVHQHFLRRFDEVWVPDFSGEASLSGALSLPTKSLSKLSHLGPLSRFYHYQSPQKEFSLKGLYGKRPEVLAVLSGPEPQRSILERILITQLQSQPGTHWIVQGKWGNTNLQTHGNCTLIPHMGTDDLYLAFTQASWVIARSGYSSLMDFSALELPRVLLVPTPGQTEQEYLAEKIQQNGIAMVASQKELDLGQVFSRKGRVKGFQNQDDSPDFSHIVDAWLAD